jgi:autotransporter-associated beta strand protein
LQVDPTNNFSVNGGTLNFNLIKLMPSTVSPAKLVIGGDATYNYFTPLAALVTNGPTTGTSGSIDLAGGTRAINVPASADVTFATPIANGGLTKTGGGTLRLNGVNTYAAGTTLSAGTLVINNSGGSGTGTGAVTVNGGTLAGSGTISGAVTVNSAGTFAPGPLNTIGTFTLNSAPILNGTNFVRIDRNFGTPLADKLVLTSGTMTLGGTLVVSNAGASLVGGEMFTNFVAPGRAGAFAATRLPSLAAGLNWYLGDLVPFGRLKVNRAPVTGALSYTNTPGQPFTIPFASIIAAATDADADPLAINGINLTTSAGVTLTTNATSITYSNAQNGADTISYTVTDAHGGITAGTVNIAPSSTGVFTQQPDVGANSVTLHLLGAPGSTYFVERSTNLPSWVTIRTNVMPSNGVLDYADNFADLGMVPAAAFYRLRWLQ